MYQTTFFEAASSSMVRWMRPSNSPNHFCPAIRSAPLASKTLQPCRSSRRPSSLRNEVLPTRTSPLTSSERGCDAEHVGSGFGQCIGPVRGLDEHVVGGGLPEAAERGEEGAIDAHQPRPVERREKLGGERMADAGENGLDGLARLRADAVETRAELGCIAEARAFLEVLAESRDHEHIVPPPLARRKERAAGGRPRVGDGVGAERKVHRPGRQRVEVRANECERFVAIIAVEQRGERGAGKEPVGAYGVVAHDGERHALVGQAAGAPRRTWDWRSARADVPRCWFPDRWH